MLVLHVHVALFLPYTCWFLRGSGYASISRSGPALGEGVQHSSALGDSGDADTRPAALAVHEHCRVVDCAASQRQEGEK